MPASGKGAPFDRFAAYEVQARVLTLHSVPTLQAMLAELPEGAGLEGGGAEARIWRLAITAELESRADPPADAPAG